MTARFPGDAHALAAEQPTVQAEFEQAVAQGDTRLMPVIAGEAADLIYNIAPAAEIVAVLMRETAAALRSAERHFR